MLYYLCDKAMINKEHVLLALRLCLISHLDLDIKCRFVWNLSRVASVRRATEMAAELSIVNNVAVVNTLIEVRRLV